MSLLTDIDDSNSVRGRDYSGIGQAVPNRGMPPLDLSGAPLSIFEFWPIWAFYGPVFVYTLWLMARHRGITLPTIANPAFPGGGFSGESKAQILSIARQRLGYWVAPFITLDRPVQPGDIDTETQAALSALSEAGLSLPVVAKPDLGCRGVGVRLIRTATDLRAYIAAFPAGATLILQHFVDKEGEAGVFYVRRPGTARGDILSLTLKYFPYVIGDGHSSLRQLIMNDPRAGRLSHLYLPRHQNRLDMVLPKGRSYRLAFAGSHSRGSIFRDGTDLVTPALRERFEEIGGRLPDFHFGRYDIRFDSFESVLAGEDFTIVEVNGAGAEMTHVWDRKTPLLQAWRDILRQYRLLFEIGSLNRDRGFKPLGLAEFLTLYRRERQLTPLYPPTQ